MRLILNANYVRGNICDTTEVYKEAKMMFTASIEDKNTRNTYTKN